MTDGDDTGTTYVLGWDGLDYTLCEEFGVADEFVPYHTRTDTFANGVLGKPGTYELWPSIITGTRPEEHGVWLIHEENGGAGAANPFVDIAAGAMHRYLPTRARLRVGIALRNRGLSLNQKSADWYRRNGVSTVFDGRDSRVIGLPNYRTEADEGLDLLSGWGRKMSRYLEVHVDETAERVVYRPKKSLDAVDDWLASEVGKKAGIVRARTDTDHDIVFVWFAYIDTVGHATPAVSDPGWGRRAYEHAAEVTQEIRGAINDEDTVIVASDHGNREGQHTFDAFFGATDERALEGIESVLDYRKGIDRVTGERDEPATETPYEVEVKPAD
ncbi:MAG: nucleotide pyrophosphatase [Halobacteriales archaeon]